MKKLSLLLLCLILLGCNAQKQLEKKINKAKVVAYEYPSEFSEFCSKAFPIIPTYVKGKDSIIERTVTVKGDSIPCPENAKGEVMYVKCPDAKIQYKDVFRTDTIVKENTAKVVYLEAKVEATEDKLKESNQDIDKYKKRAETLLFWVISMGVLLLGSLYLHIIRK